MDQDDVEFEQLLGEIPRATSAPPHVEEIPRTHSSGLLSSNETSGKPYSDISKGDGSSQASTHVYSHDRELIYPLSHHHHHHQQQQRMKDEQGLPCILGSLSLNSYCSTKTTGMTCMMPAHAMDRGKINGAAKGGSFNDHYLVYNMNQEVGERVSRSAQFGEYSSFSYHPHTLENQPTACNGHASSSFPNGLVCSDPASINCPNWNPFADPHKHLRNIQHLQEHISLQEEQFQTQLYAQTQTPACIPRYTIMPISRMQSSMQLSPYQPCMPLASHSQPLLYKQHRHLVPVRQLTWGKVHSQGATIPAHEPFHLPQFKGIYNSSQGYCSQEEYSPSITGNAEIAQINSDSHQLPGWVLPAEPFPLGKSSNSWQAFTSDIRSTAGLKASVGSLTTGGRLPYLDHELPPSLHSSPLLSEMHHGDVELNDVRHLDSGTSHLLQNPKYSSLEELQGQIYAIAKDQHGCRFLQRKFDEGKEEDITRIFSEIFDYLVELMTDPFGNYLIQKLLEVCTESQRMQMLLAITKKSELVSISLNSHGTRAVQKLIETLTLPEQVDIVTMSLRQGVVTLIKDLNGNHVIQRCLQCLSNKDSEFIFDAAESHCVEIATHRHGCCVLQRCVDFAMGPQRDRLVSEIATNALILSQDPYGNYVVQYILDLNILWVSNELMVRLESNYSQLAMQKFSSNVVEKCLKLADDKNRARIIQELRTSSCLGQLLHHEYANYVIQCALSVSKGALHSSLVEALFPHLPSLKTSPYGKRILSRTNLKKKQFVHV